jgi:methionine--tRNA ligase beta chain
VQSFVVEEGVHTLEVNMEVLPKVEKKKEAPKKQEKSEKKQKAKKEDKKDDKNVAVDLFPLLDLRIGKVLEVKVHPDAEKIFIEKIDVGEEQPRTILSGLRPFLKEEEFVNQNVLVICNLKPRKVRFYDFLIF